MHLSIILLCSEAVGLAAAVTLPLNRRTSQNAASMVSTQFRTICDVDVTIGGQTFQLLVDTGSSDTYVMKTGFQCISQTTNLQIPSEDCLYTKTYNISDTYRKIPNQNFGIQYGAGIASGVMAYEDVTLAGITVKGQEVGIADRSTPMGDGVNSGLLGLAYPALTSAHPGNSTSNQTYWYNRITYSPLVTSMYQQGLVNDSYFSLALARTLQNTSTGFRGYLALGELPPVHHDSNFAVAPVEIMDSIPRNLTGGETSQSILGNDHPFHALRTGPE